MALKITNSILWPIVILIIALGAFYLKPWQAKKDETISVSATGTAQTIPNIAKISATIYSNNQNLDSARKDVEAKMNIIVSKLKSLQIEEKDIKTESISANSNPQIMIYPPIRQQSQFSNSIEITIRNFDNADKVIAALTANGATNIYGPNLQSSEDELTKAKSNARENAVNEAKNKASELAKLSNRSLGKVVSIKEAGDYAYPQPLMAVSSSDLKEKAAQINPGQNNVTINLSVDFSLN